MFKIWAKLFNDRNVMIQNELFCFDEEFEKEKMFNYVSIICEKWKLETPVILSKHRDNIVDFNSVKFTKDDFIDYIEFEKMVLEYVE